MPIAKKILYRGRVQGVGFRFTTREIAQGFAVAGYVRNLDNGEVEVVVEGEPDEVVRFVESLERRMNGHIHDRSVDEEPVRSFTSFEILR